MMFGPKVLTYLLGSLASAALPVLSAGRLLVPPILVLRETSVIAPVP